MINNFETALFAAIPVTLLLPTVEVELGHIDLLPTVVASQIYFCSKYVSHICTCSKDVSHMQAWDGAILQLKHMPALALQPVLNSASALVT